MHDCLRSSTSSLELGIDFLTVLSGVRKPGTCSIATTKTFGRENSMALHEPCPVLVGTGVIAL